MRSLVKELKEMVQTYVIRFKNLTARVEATSYEDALERFADEVGMTPEELRDLKKKLPTN